MLCNVCGRHMRYDAYDDAYICDLDNVVYAYPSDEWETY